MSSFHCYHEDIRGFPAGIPGFKEVWCCSDWVVSMVMRFDIRMGLVKGVRCLLQCFHCLYLVVVETRFTAFPLPGFLPPDLRFLAARITGILVPGGREGMRMILPEQAVIVQAMAAATERQSNFFIVCYLLFFL